MASLGRPTQGAATSPGLARARALPVALSPRHPRHTAAHTAAPAAADATAQPLEPLPPVAAATAAAVAPAAPPAAEGIDPEPSHVRPPLALVTVRTLPTQASLAAAVAALRAAVLDVPAQAGGYASGLVRLEVPLPQGATALSWLRGQPGPDEDAASLLHPRVYFSPRRTTAADTDGSAAAGAAAGGAGAVAGAGAAWLWRGAPGQPLGEATMRDVRRFLGSAGAGADAAAGRVRAFGGARFDAARAPAPEWREFGSFCFLIPRLELLEAGSCCTLACTLAWDAAHVVPAPGAGPPPSGAALGFATVGAAAMDATAALDAAAPPAPPAAGALKLRRLAARTVPDEPGWHALMDRMHGALAASAAAQAEAIAAEAAESAAANGGAAPPPVDACQPLLKLCPEAAREEYLLNGQEGLDDLLAALEPGFEAAGAAEDGALTKVVLARRTDVTLGGVLEPLALLQALQERDPRAYQLMLQMPSGACFVSSTPECLYTRTGAAVASEAVAGTRARGPGGDVERDFWLAFDLLRSHKDHLEFTVVRDWVAQALAGVCEAVSVDVAKSVLKQGAVQHLYGKLSGQLKPGAGDAALLAALHPTPAVCGRPREDAQRLLAATEPFDRGFYAGPFGWVSAGAAEFAVAIRSALVQPGAGAAPAPDAEGLAARQASHAAAGPGPSAGAALQPPTRVSLFAGVGIVRGSESAQEWAELDLKVRQYERLLQGAPPLAAAPNVNALWARLLVEELCRLGCNTFCVAPGSRSSPLTVAVAQHPRARIVPCIDERSLGFWALGHGRATGRPAVVITSSGTAVANLLPAAVEASQSGVPLLLLTGDRPAELRDSGANQAIDQVKLFGGYARWHADLPAPDGALPARLALSAADTAVAAATGLPPGPVHLNCQFREPLAPVEAGDWDRACLQGLERWEAGDAPFTATAALAPPAGFLAPPPAQLPGVAGAASSGVAAAAAAAGLAADPAAAAALRVIAGARRGLIVAAELAHPDDAAAAVQLAALLGWPVAADVLSGLRAGVQAAGAGASAPAVIHHFDHLLLADRQHWAALRPDVVLQLGGHLTSKRVNQFLEWCCCSEPQPGGGSGGSGRPPQPAAQWVLADRSPRRHDQFHLLSHRLQAPLPALAAALGARLAARGAGGAAAAERRRYAELLRLLDGQAGGAVDAALADMQELTEPAVARALARLLPPGEALFVGNSMPIRDLDMYACPPRAGRPAAAPQGAVQAGLGARVGANRGASGIDGVLSTAAGFADGLARGATLVVGDISFLHDVNGLNLLRSGEARPPLTVVLVNNGGGAIFSFLPIAESLPEEVFTPLWATPQHVDLEGMCRAHGIPHQKVAAEADLAPALRSAWGCNRHSVVEVVTSRATNLQRHRDIQARVKAAVEAALWLTEQAGAAAAWAMPPACGQFELAVRSAFYQPFRLPLARPLTTGAGSSSEPGHRAGLLLHVALAAPGGGVAHGVGEVTPLPGLHAETLEQAQQQVALLCQLLAGAAASGSSNGSSSNGSSSNGSSPVPATGARVPLTVALLGGRLAAWLRSGLGVDPESLLPSVRCGLEAALLSALAAHRGVSLAELLARAEPLAAPEGRQRQLAEGVALNGLLDSQGSPEEAAAEAAALLATQPYAALKVKVGRRGDPLADAAALLAIRAAAGPGVVLRADANRRWTLEQAEQFARAAAGAGLEYVEEPLAVPADLPQLHRRTGLPLALDETVDGGLVGPGAADGGGEALCEGVAALVLKPSALGGYERTAALAGWAAARGMRAVVSSAFESGVGVSQLAQLAAAVDAGGAAAMQHGLATLAWLAEDLLPQGSQPLLQLQPGVGVAISLRAAHAAADSAAALALGLAHGGVQARVARRCCHVATGAGSYELGLLEALPAPATDSASPHQPPVLLLHGFLGGADDWLPLMAALGLKRRCVALDLPGHGATAVLCAPGSGASGDGASPRPRGGAYSLEAMAEAVAALVEREGLQGCLLAGYSLGGRLALLLAARWPHLFCGVACVSGTPGLPDPAARAERAARDDALAAALRQAGLARFTDDWYRQPMWSQLRGSPRFKATLRQRRAGGDAQQLAAALAAASPGRAPSLWRELPAAAAAGALPPLLLVAGTEDGKFAGVAAELAAQLAPAGTGSVGVAQAEVALVPSCGHAVHIERPVELLTALQRFSSQLDVGEAAGARTGG